MYMCSKSIGVIMSIQSVNAINFTGKTAQTKNGNEYEKTNAGKYTGMGVGAAAGAGYGVYIINKVNKSYSLKKYIINAFNSGFTQFGKLGNIKNTISQLEISLKEFRATRYKCLSRILKAIPAILGAVTLLAGLGVGAITDGIINHTRAKKADNTEKTEA